MDSEYDIVIHSEISGTLLVENQVKDLAIFDDLYFFSNFWKYRLNVLHRVKLLLIINVSITNELIISVPRSVNYRSWNLIEDLSQDDRVPRRPYV
jgi:hypothetical protein